MRKFSILMFGVIFLFFVVAAYSQNITVTSPKGGENWQIGTTHNITWNSNGVSGNIIIKLMKGSNMIGSIAWNIPNTGNYSWTINNVQGKSIQPGSNYRVLVRSMSNHSIQDQSNSNFTISSKPVPSSITVTSPKGGENWQIGTTHNITWNSNGVSGNIVIKLMKGNTMLGSIAYNIPNSGSYSWTINNVQGKTIQPGSDYKVLVRSMSNHSIQNQSNSNFSISGQKNVVLQVEPMNRLQAQQPKMNKQIFKIKPMIAISSPKKGDIILDNQKCNIKWKTTGVMYARVSVKALLINKNYLYTIAYDTSNNGSYIWDLSKASWTPGQYKIKIETLVGKVIGWSDVFTIKKVFSKTCNSGIAHKDLECMINNYRASHGLKPIPHSNSLKKVADAHVKDLAKYHPENKCNNNTHSWSKNGNWTGGCYINGNSSTYKIMWLKPKEIAGDSSYGYEIACKGCTSASGSIGIWKSSSAHNDVILNKGMWASFKWTGMAAAIYGGYSVVWFK